MADLPKPFHAYRGSGPYVFVSYAHVDAASVYPDLAYLTASGINCWYDEGISPGSRWTNELATAIEGCRVFVAFLSPAAAASENCLNEIEFALSRRRPVLVVQLSKTDLPPGLELSLGGRQAVIKNTTDAASYRDQLRSGIEALSAGAGSTVRHGGPRAATTRRNWMAAFVAVSLLAGWVLIQINRSPPATPELRLAVAVRPFANAIAHADGDPFADGLADDLILRLDRWRSLPVIARGSSFAADIPSDPVAAGKALNARYVVEGAVRGNAEELKLSVYLVDADIGRTVWSTELERPWDQVLTMQADVADTIVAQISPALLSAETGRAVRADPEALDAWSAAMRGWWHLNTESRSGLNEAQIWFARAIDLDPTWSWPHSAQALAAYRSIINGWSSDTKVSVATLTQSAQRAVQLDPLDAFGHHALGHAYAMEGRIQQSLDALARGVELSPSDSMANGCYAMQLAASNRPTESLKYVDFAMSISPNDPWLHRFALIKSRANFAAEAYAESERWALRSLQLRPNSGAFLHSVAAPALGDGLDRARRRVEEASASTTLPALAAIEQGFKRQTNPGYLARLITGLRRAGFE